MATIWGLASCDTSRKARKSLPEAAFVDVRTSPLDRETLMRFHAEFGDALLNRRSTTWRGLTEQERSGDATELIARHPALMKRPVIERDGRLYLGWTAEVRDALGA